MGIFDIGDFITLGLVVFVFVVMRRFDQHNRSLDGVKRFFDKTRTEFDAYMRRNQEHLQDLSNEISSYDKTSKEVLRRIEIDAREVREQAENLNQVKTVMVELLSVRDNVMESLENLKEDATYITEMSRRVEGLEQKIQQVEASGDRLLLELAERNEKSLELQRKTLDIVFEKDRETLQSELQKMSIVASDLHQELDTILVQKEEVLVRNLRAYSQELDRVSDIYSQKLHNLEAAAMQMETEGLLIVKQNLDHEFEKIKENIEKMFLHEVLHFKNDLETQTDSFQDFLSQYGEIESKIEAKFAELTNRGQILSDQYNVFDISMHNLYNYIKGTFQDESSQIKEAISERISSLSHEFSNNIEEKFQSVQDQTSLRLIDIEKLADMAYQQASNIQTAFDQEQDKLTILLVDVRHSVDQETIIVNDKVKVLDDLLKNSFTDLSTRYTDWQNRIKGKLDNKQEELENLYQQKIAFLGEHWENFEKDIADTSLRVTSELEQGFIEHKEAIQDHEKDLQVKMELFRHGIAQGLKKGCQDLEGNREDLLSKLSSEREIISQELTQMSNDFVKARNEAYSLAEVSEQRIFEEIQNRVNDEMKNLDQEIGNGVEAMRNLISHETEGTQKLAESLQNRYQSVESDLLGKIEEAEVFYTESFGELRRKQELLIGLDEEWHLSFEGLQLKLEDDVAGVITDWRLRADNAFENEIANESVRYKDSLEGVISNLNERVNSSVNNVEDLEILFKEYRENLELQKRDHQLYVEEYIGGWQKEFESTKEYLERKGETLLLKCSEDSRQVCQKWQEEMDQWQLRTQEMSGSVNQQFGEVELRVATLDEQWRENFVHTQEEWENLWTNWKADQNSLLQSQNQQSEESFSELQGLAQVFRREMYQLKENFDFQSENMQTQLRENVEKVEQDLYGRVEGLQEELKDRIQGMETTFNQNENKWNDLEQNFGLEMESKKQGLYEKIEEKNQEIEGFVETKFQDWNDTENKINVHLENQKEIVTQDFFQYQENFNQKTKQFKDVIEKELQQGYKFLEENRQDLIMKFSTERDCVRKELGNVAKDFSKAREEVHALAEISEQKLFEEIRIRIQDEMKYLDQDISSGIEEMKQRISDGTGNIEKIAESLNDRCEHIEHGLLAKIEESEGFYTELFGDLRSKQEGLIKLDEEWKQGFEDLKVKLEDDMGHAIERWHENSDKNFNQEIADGRLRYKEGLDQVVVDLNQSVDLSIDKLGNLETILDGYRDGLEDRKRDQDLYIESYISGWTTEFETEKVRFQAESQTLFSQYSKDSHEVSESWKDEIEHWRIHVLEIRNSLERQFKEVQSSVTQVDEQWKISFLSTQEGWQAAWSNWQQDQKTLVESEHQKSLGSFVELHELAESFRNQMHDLGQNFENQADNVQTQLRKSVNQVESEWYSRVDTLKQELQDRVQGVEQHLETWKNIESTIHDHVEYQKQIINNSLLQCQEQLETHESHVQTLLTQEETELAFNTSNFREDIAGQLSDIKSDIYAKISLIKQDLKSNLQRFDQDFSQRLANAEQIGKHCSENVEKLCTEIQTEAKENSQNLLAEVKVHQEKWNTLQNVLNEDFDSHKIDAHVQIADFQNIINEEIVQKMEWVDDQHKIINEKVGDLEQKFVQDFTQRLANAEQIGKHCSENVKTLCTEVKTEVEENSRNLLAEVKVHQEKWNTLQNVLNENFDNYKIDAHGQITDFQNIVNEEIVQKMEWVDDQHKIIDDKVGDLEQKFVQNFTQRLANAEQIGKHCSENVETLCIEIKTETEESSRNLLAEVKAHQEKWNTLQNVLNENFDNYKIDAHGQITDFQNIINEEIVQKMEWVDDQHKIVDEKVGDLEQKFVQDFERLAMSNRQECDQYETHWKTDILKLDEQVQKHLVQTKNLSERYNYDLQNKFDELTLSITQYDETFAKSLEKQNQTWSEQILDWQKKVAMADDCLNNYQDELKAKIDQRVQACHENVSATLQGQEQALEKEKQHLHYEVQEFQKEFNENLKQISFGFTTHYDTLKQEIQNKFTIVDSMFEVFENSHSEKISMLESEYRDHQDRAEQYAKDLDLVWQNRFAELEKNWETQCNNFSLKFDTWTNLGEEKISQYMQEVQGKWNICLNEFNTLDMQRKEDIQKQHETLMQDWEDKKNEIDMAFTSHIQDTRLSFDNKFDHIEAEWSQKFDKATLELENKLQGFAQSITHNVEGIDQLIIEKEVHWKTRAEALDIHIKDCETVVNEKIQGLDRYKNLVDTRLETSQVDIENYISIQSQQFKQQITDNLSSFEKDVQQNWQQNLQGMKDQFLEDMKKIDMEVVQCETARVQLDEEKNNFLNHLQSLMHEADTFFSDGKEWLENQTQGVEVHCKSFEQQWHDNFEKLAESFDQEKQNLDDIKTSFKSNLLEFDAQSTQQIQDLVSQGETFRQQWSQEKDVFLQDFAAGFDQFEKDKEKIQLKITHYHHELEKHWDQYSQDFDIQDQLMITQQKEWVDQKQKGLESFFASAAEGSLVLKSDYEKRLSQYFDDFNLEVQDCKNAHDASQVEVKQLYQSGLDLMQKLTTETENYVERQKDYIQKQEEDFNGEWKSLLGSLSDQQQQFEQQWMQNIDTWYSKELDLSKLQDVFEQKSDQYIETLIESMENKSQDVLIQYENQLDSELKNKQQKFLDSQMHFEEDKVSLEKLYNDSLQNISDVSQQYETYLQDRRSSVQEREQDILARYDQFFESTSQSKTQLEAEHVYYFEIMRNSKDEFDIVKGEMIDKYTEYLNENLEIQLQSLVDTGEKQQKDFSEAYNIQRKNLDKILDFNQIVFRDLESGKQVFDKQQQTWANLITELSKNADTLQKSCEEKIEHMTLEQDNFQKNCGDLLVKGEGEAKIVLERMKEFLANSNALSHQFQDKIQSAESEVQEYIKNYTEHVAKMFHDQENGAITDIEEHKQKMFAQNKKHFDEMYVNFQEFVEEQKTSLLRNLERSDLQAKQSEKLLEIENLLNNSQGTIDQCVYDAREKMTYKLQNIDTFLQEFDQKLDEGFDQINVYRNRLDQYFDQESQRGQESLKDYLAQFEKQLDVYFKDTVDKFHGIDAKLEQEQIVFQNTLNLKLEKSGELVKDTESRLLEVKQNIENYVDNLEIQQKSVYQEFIDKIAYTDTQIQEQMRDLGYNIGQFEKDFSERRDNLDQHLRQEQTVFQRCLDKVQAEIDQGRQQLLLQQDSLQENMNHLEKEIEKHFESCKVHLIDKLDQKVLKNETSLLQNIAEKNQASEEKLQTVTDKVIRFEQELDARISNYYDQIKNNFTEIEQVVTKSGSQLKHYEKDFSERRENLDQHLRQEQTVFQRCLDKVQSEIDQKRQELLLKQDSLQENMNHLEKEIEKHFESCKVQLIDKLDQKVFENETFLLQNIAEKNQESEAKLQTVTDKVIRFEQELDSRIANYYEQFKNNFTEIEQVVAKSERQLKHYEKEIEDSRLTLESRMLVLRDNTMRELANAFEELKSVITGSVHETHEQICIEFMTQLEGRLHEYEGSIQSKMERLGILLDEFDLLESNLKSSIEDTSQHIVENLKELEQDLTFKHQKEADRIAIVLDETNALIPDLQIQIDFIREQTLTIVRDKLISFEKEFMHDVDGKENQITHYIEEWQQSVEKTLKDSAKQSRIDHEILEKTLEQETESYLQSFRNQTEEEMGQCQKRLSTFITELNTRSAQIEDDVMTLYQDFATRTKDSLMQEGEKRDNYFLTSQGDITQQISNSKKEIDLGLQMISQYLSEEKTNFTNMMNTYRNDCVVWQSNSQEELKNKELRLTEDFAEFKQRLYKEFEDLSVNIVQTKESITEKLRNEMQEVSVQFSDQNRNFFEFLESKKDYLEHTLNDLTQRVDETGKGFDDKVASVIYDLESIGEKTVTQVEQCTSGIQKDMTQQFEYVRMEVDQLRNHVTDLREQAEQSIESRTEIVVNQLTEIETKQKAIEASLDVLGYVNEMRGKFETSLVDLSFRIKDVDEKWDKIIEFEGELSRALRMNDELSARITTLTQERRKVDTLDQKMRDAVDLAGVVERKMSQLTEFSHGMEDIYVRLNELATRESDLHIQFDKLDNKVLLANETAKSVDSSFEKMQILDHSLQQTFLEISDIKSSLDGVRSGIQMLDSQKTHIESFNNLIMGVDQKINDMESRVTRIDEMREWVVQAENRMIDLQKNLKSNLRMTAISRDSEISSGELGDRDTVIDTIIKLARQGWSSEQIASQLKISVGQVTLVIDRWGGQ